MKSNNILWAASLIVIGLATVIIAVTQIAGAELSDTVRRILGIIDLIALPVLAFSTVRKVKGKA